MSTENFDNMTTSEFESRLPELITPGPDALLSDPGFATFFEKNPDCAALVRDLAAIAKAARDLMELGNGPSDEPEEEQVDLHDDLWDRIKGEIGKPSLAEPDGVLE